MRNYPIFKPGRPVKLRPISFVTVHFCDDYYHNILQSSCVHDPINQLITVDNRWGHRYDNLSTAINEGLAQTVHDLVAVVHEDVYLAEGWQVRLQQSLNELEAADPDWGLAGSVGWDCERNAIGYWSDPKECTDTLGDRAFAPVRQLDEQILIFQKSGGLQFDNDLPSIHNIGRDLASQLAADGRKTYAVNAPTIHKYADESGEPILSPDQSPKIRTRTIPANLMEWKCSNAYLHAKWPSWAPARPPRDLQPELDEARFGSPVIMLARGGSGSRLLSTLAADLGLFLGNDLNVSGDCMDMVEAIYRGVFSTYQHRVDWQRAQVVPRLRAHAARMLEQGAPSGPWGFKLPEAMLILPELDRAFPNARYLHLIRDPLSTCLRRTHMTARFDNAIGRTAIRAAYVHCNRPIERSMEDSPALRMACTTRHQIETVRAHAAAHLGNRYLELRFEDLMDDPRGQRTKVAGWLGIAPVDDRLSAEIDSDRARSPSVCYPEEAVRATRSALIELRCELGYGAVT